MKKSIQSVFLVFVFLTVWLSGCAPASTPVPLTFTPIPPTSTPVPTDTLAPTATAVPPTATFTSVPVATAIPASNEPVNIGDYSIVLSSVQVTDIGWNPFGLTSNLALVVDVSEETGKLDEISKLEVWFADDQGNKFTHQATEVGTNFQGKPSLTWNVWISQPANGYFMYFPTGEVIDLSPLIP